MIFSVLLLSAGVVSTPVFISEVKAAREVGHLRVDVRADGGIDPEDGADEHRRWTLVHLSRRDTCEGGQPGLGFGGRVR